MATSLHVNLEPGVITTLDTVGRKYITGSCSLQWSFDPTMEAYNTEELLPGLDLPKATVYVRVLSNPTTIVVNTYE